jgi:hypothetical protein
MYRPGSREARGLTTWGSNPWPASFRLFSHHSSAEPQRLLGLATLFASKGTNSLSLEWNIFVRKKCSKRIYIQTQEDPLSARCCSHRLRQRNIITRGRISQGWKIYRTSHLQCNAVLYIRIVIVCSLSEINARTESANTRRKAHGLMDRGPY